MDRRDALEVGGAALLAAVAGALAGLSVAAPDQPGPLPLPLGAAPAAGIGAVVLALFVGLLTARDRVGDRGRTRRAIERAGRTGAVPPDADPDVWIPLLARQAQRLGSGAISATIIGGLCLVVTIGSLAGGGAFYRQAPYALLLVLGPVAAVRAVVVSRRARPRLLQAIDVLRARRQAALAAG